MAEGCRFFLDSSIPDCVFAFSGGQMWLCYSNHGSVLVHRVHAAGCDLPPTRCSLPHDGHHDG